MFKRLTTFFALAATLCLSDVKAADPLFAAPPDDRIELASLFNIRRSDSGAQPVNVQKPKPLPSAVIKDASPEPEKQTGDIIPVEPVGQEPEQTATVPEGQDAPPAQQEEVKPPEKPAETARPAQPDSGSQAREPRPYVQKTPSVRQVKRGEVSFNFDDADVFSVIQTVFGDILQVNYVVDPRVKGRVNFRSVAPVAKNDVLSLMEVILRLNGVGVVEEAGLFRIVPIGDLPKEPAPVGIGREAEKIVVEGKSLLQIVPVNYINSQEMIRILTPFLSSNAVVVDVPKSNHLILVDTDANIRKLLSLVEIFDSEKLKKTKPQVFVYPVQNSKAKDVASMLQQIYLGSKPATPPPAKTPAQQSPQPASKGAAPSEPPAVHSSTPALSPQGGTGLVDEITKIIADEVQNSIVILATPADYLLIEETIRKIDVLPRQVMIEAVVAAVELIDNMRFGLQWRIQNDFTISGMKPFEKDINITGPLDFAAKITNPTLTFTAFDSTGGVKLLIQSLADENKAKILSSPHILVSDNREARIQVGDQIPIATSTTSSPIVGGTVPTNTTTSTIQYKDTGTILKVKPQVNDSGLVSIELTQEVSKGKTINVLGTEQFQITKKEITTNLVAQDGQTVVIGGLIDEVVAKGRSGMPFLSKIPLLGYLFGSTVDDFARAELVILLTPRVVKSPKEAASTSAEYLDRFKDNTKLKVEEIIPEKKK